MIWWLHCRVFTKHWFTQAITCPLQGSFCSLDIFALLDGCTLGYSARDSLRLTLHNTSKHPSSMLSKSVTNHMSLPCCRIIGISGLQMPLSRRRFRLIVGDGTSGDNEEGYNKNLVASRLTVKEMEGPTVLPILANGIFDLNKVFEV